MLVYQDPTLAAADSKLAEVYAAAVALQARYRLLPSTGAATYLCDGQPGDEVTATFFATDGGRGARRPGVADGPAAGRERCQVSGPERDALGASGRGADHLGLRQPGNALPGEALTR